MTLGDLLSDPQILNALSAFLGPLAFFAAPTDKVEDLVYSQDAQEEDEVSLQAPTDDTGESEPLAEPVPVLTSVSH